MQQKVALYRVALTKGHTKDPWKGNFLDFEMNPTFFIEHGIKLIHLYELRAIFYI